MPKLNRLQWFVDVSKIGDMAVGVYRKTTRTKLSFALGLQKGRPIEICSDLQAVLLAIEYSKVKSRLVPACKKTLNDLASHNRVILNWVPGHSGVRENEEGDRLAREGIKRLHFTSSQDAQLLKGLENGTLSLTLWELCSKPGERQEYSA
ncbi:hypothetical protein NQ317_005758 [Molorchus minor]|uniref:RNase H type-1 domain-containing protein n=1 Tax=Molorchus minor TaxID=1323400 RepID=A0ABQ9JSH2_9CUCU|nr:hypothetical protein NQ317_005758 [Molorchus minor]